MRWAKPYSRYRVTAPRNRPNAMPQLQPQPQVDAILARLLARHPKRIDLSLDRMWHVLDRLGHPEKSLPPVVHVAGTNGKGSTIAFMRAMLEAAGARGACLHTTH